MTFDVAVVGLGMIGSAALKYLALKGVRVIGIGSGEPQDWKAHHDVFSSHYDDGRIARILDADETWGRLAQASLARFQDIEYQSGIRFCSRSGCLKVGDEDYIFKNKSVGDRLNVEFERIDADLLSRRVPSLNMSGCAGLLEGGAAGYIAPQELIRAQQNLAVKNGARLLDRIVHRIEWNAKESCIHLSTGEKVTADRVLVTAGAFINFHSLLPREIPIVAKAETVIRIRVPSTLLNDLPGSFICARQFSESIPYLYGTFHRESSGMNSYLKLGTQNDGLVFSSLEEIVSYFHSGGSSARAEEIMGAACQLLPSLAGLPYAIKPCILSYSPGGLPLIDEVLPGRGYIVAGCCGAAAKSSDEIGRIAVERLSSGIRIKEFSLPE